jgi:hypothetical protein
VAKSNTPIELISPYENIVIGNFLFGLGAAIGLNTRGKAQHACVNLLQQTPLDPTLEAKRAYEIDPTLMREVSGGLCDCQGKKVTKTQNQDGTVTYSVDEA